MASIWLFILIAGMALPLAFSMRGYVFLMNHAPAMLVLILVAAAVLMWTMFRSARDSQARAETKTLGQQIMPVVVLVGLLISTPMLLGLLAPDECTSPNSGLDLSLSACMRIASERIQHN